MAEYNKNAQDQTSCLVYLLECLAFTINIDKSALGPSKSLEFLDFTINTMMMELSLPAEKLKKI